MDRPALKKEIRKKISALRQSLSPAEAQAKSEAIFGYWKKFYLSLDHKPRILHLFLSMPERNEVDTAPIRGYIEAYDPDIKVVVPVVDQLSGTLKHVWVSPDVELVKSRFGVPEPKMQTKIIHPAEMDLVLVPLLGFDEKGNRLGYGKGHYDGFLKSVRADCLKIGLAFEVSRWQEELPAEPHDVRLDYVITEKGIQKFS